MYHRLWQLYVTHIFLFMIFMAMVAYTVGALNQSLFAEEFGAICFIEDPGLALVQALMLQFQPAFMGILPLYIVLPTDPGLQKSDAQLWETFEHAANNGCDHRHHLFRGMVNRVSRKELAETQSPQ